MISFRPLLFFLPFSISFCFRWFRWFRFISFSFRWFRFVSFRFCWFRWFRFVSHFIGTHIVMYFYLDCHCNKKNSAAWLCVQQKCLEQSVSFWFILFIYSRTCLIRHTKGPGKCVGLYRMSEYTGFILVYRNTRDHKFLLDVTGCRKTKVLECRSYTV